MTDTEILALKPSQVLIQFAEQDAARALAESRVVERRREPRVPVIVPILLQPVNEQLLGVGEPVAVVARNITKRGFTIVAEHWQSHSLFVVRVSAEGRPYTLLAEERWHRANDGYTTVGLNVVRQLTDLPFPCRCDV